jgi:hypothetical protein
LPASAFTVGAAFSFLTLILGKAEQFCPEY